MYDVLVIGGGPVGSQVAYRLSTAGRKVAVVEEKTDLYCPVCCTGIVSEECVREYEIDETVIHRHVNGAFLYSPSGRLIRLHRNEPQAAVLDRPAFNALMAARARSCGTDYFISARVTDVAIADEHVTIRCGDAQPQTLYGSAAVIATGFNPTLTQQAGLGKPGDIVGGAQTEVETGNVHEVEVYLGGEFSPGLFAWLVPTSPGKALAGLLSRRTPKERLRTFLSFLAGRAKIASAEVKIEVGGVPLKPITRTVTDRLLVVGTAAGQVKPTTGGGIYYGLLCADIAADTLHMALQKGDLSRRSLSVYQQRCDARLGEEMKAGRKARTLYEMLSNNQIDRIFDIMQRHGVVEALLRDPDLSFDWHSHAIRHLLGQRTLAKLFRGTSAIFRGTRVNE